MKNLDNYISTEMPSGIIYYFPKELGYALGTGEFKKIIRKLEKKALDIQQRDAESKLKELNESR